MKFYQSILAKYDVEHFHDPKAPKWNPEKVEHILKGHGPLTIGETEELEKALDYYAYINDLAGDQDEDVLDNVDKELHRLQQRYASSLKANKVQKNHLRLVGWVQRSRK